MNTDISDIITCNLLKFIYEQVTDKEERLNILNISCDVKKIYNELQSNYKNSNIFNIEMDIQHKDNLNIIPNTQFGSFERSIIQCDKEFFDYIIMDDTIQRFMQPLEVIEYLKYYVKNKGSLLLSIPNVLHIDVIKDMLKGNLIYKDYGPLSISNLRFFTSGEVKNLIEKSSYKLDCVNYVVTDKTEYEMNLIEGISTLADKNFMDELNIYGFLVNLSKEGYKTLFDYINNE